MNEGNGPEQMSQNPEELIGQANSIDEIIAIIVAEDVKVTSGGKLRSAQDLALALDNAAAKLEEIKSGALALDKEAILTQLPRAYGIRRKVAQIEGIPYQD